MVVSSRRKGGRAFCSARGGRGGDGHFLNLVQQGSITIDTIGERDDEGRGGGGLGGGDRL